MKRPFVPQVRRKSSKEGNRIVMGIGELARDGLVSLTSFTCIHHPAHHDGPPFGWRLGLFILGSVGELGCYQVRPRCRVIGTRWSAYAITYLADFTSFEATAASGLQARPMHATSHNTQQTNLHSLPQA